jgi:osmotically-inducible protein OsmY
MIPNWLASTVIVALAAPLLSGCVLLAGAGAVAGLQTARQERSIGDALDDRAIKTTLDAKLRQASGLRFGIATTVVEGRVLLAGRVSAPEARLDATRLAWTIHGVVKVDNDIEVAETSGWLDRPQDFIMRQALVAKILGDSSIREVNYTTDVVHGVVYLMGVGQDQAEVDRVVAHANSLTNVRRVENYVVLKDDPIREGGSVASQNTE